MAHVVTLIAIAPRTSKPVMGLFKKASRMQGFLGKNHRDIVIKAQRGDVEEHLQFSLYAPDADAILQQWAGRTTSE